MGPGAGGLTDLIAQDNPATSNQPTILLYQNKPAISHQSNEQTEFISKHPRPHRLLVR
jgi:hypothetical protein